MQVILVSQWQEKVISVKLKSPIIKPFRLYGACARTNSMLDVGSTVFVKPRMKLKEIPATISVSFWFWLLFVGLHSAVL